MNTEKMTFHEMMGVRAESLGKKLPAFLEALAPYVEENDLPADSAAGMAYDTLFSQNVTGVYPGAPGVLLIDLAVKVLQDWHAEFCGVPGQKYEPYTLTIKGSLVSVTKR